MPELPEVETTRRGLEPYVVGQKITEVIVRHRGLRQPVSESLEEIAGHKITSIVRRAKYLIVALKDAGHLIIHLGMSGSLRISTAGEDFKKHDHIALQLQSGKQMRFHDPRRFGIFLHVPEGDPLQHPLLRDLGPEPLDAAFSTDNLTKACAGKKIAIKVAIMDAKIVVGVNRYQLEQEAEIELLRVDPALEQQQIERVQGVRARRDSAAAERSLAALKEASLREDANLMPLLIEASRAYVTMGEMCDALRETWGTWRETPVF